VVKYTEPNGQCKAALHALCDFFLPQEASEAKANQSVSGLNDEPIAKSYGRGGGLICHSRSRFLSQKKVTQGVLYIGSRLW